LNLFMKQEELQESNGKIFGRSVMVKENLQEVTHGYTNKN
jgi:hypothetical protein